MNKGKPASASPTQPPGPGRITLIRRARDSRQRFEGTITLPDPCEECHRPIEVQAWSVSVMPPYPRQRYHHTERCDPVMRALAARWNERPLTPPNAKADGGGKQRPQLRFHPATGEVYSDADYPEPGEAALRIFERAYATHRKGGGGR